MRIKINNLEIHTCDYIQVTPTYSHETGHLDIFMSLYGGSWERDRQFFYYMSRQEFAQIGYFDMGEYDCIKNKDHKATDALINKLCDDILREPLERDFLDLTKYDNFEYN